jgi:hypothetical protein
VSGEHYLDREMRMSRRQSEGLIAQYHRAFNRGFYFGLATGLMGGAGFVLIVG